MPLPIQAQRATLTIAGVTYDLRNVHVMASFEQTSTPVYGAGRVIGRTVGSSTERVTIEAEVAEVAMVDAGIGQAESDADLRDRMLNMWVRPMTVQTATGEALDALADTYGTVRLGIDPVIDMEADEAMARLEARKTRPEAKSRYERLLAQDDLV